MTSTGGMPAEDMKEMRGYGEISRCDRDDDQRDAG